MAGGAAKKAGSRKLRATLIYGGIVAVTNVLFFALRLAVWRQALSRREWTGVFFLAGSYALSLFSLIPAAGLDVTPEASLDLLGLCVVVQLGSLYTARAWWLLALIPLYFVYSFWGPLASLVGGWGGANTGPMRGLEGSEGDDKAMEAKRQRRAEHKAKHRVVVGGR